MSRLNDPQDGIRPRRIILRRYRRHIRQMMPEFLARGGHQRLFESRDFLCAYGAVLQDFERTFGGKEVGEGCGRGWIFCLSVESGGTVSDTGFCGTRDMSEASGREKKWGGGAKVGWMDGYY